MGDRAQIIIERSETRIHLYTHWSGHKLPCILSDALKAGFSRWSDDSYLTRIIFCHMLDNAPKTDTTGFGISTGYQDSCEETDLIVDMDHRTVHYGSHHWTFQAYIDLSPVTWSDLS